jgi:hypothetical protein
MMQRDCQLNFKSFSALNGLDYSVYKSLSEVILLYVKIAATSL